MLYIVFGFRLHLFECSERIACISFCFVILASILPSKPNLFFFLDLFERCVKLFEPRKFVLFERGVKLFERGELFEPRKFVLFERGVKLFERGELFERFRFTFVWDRVFVWGRVLRERFTFV
jgi:hypothetical protein